MTIWGRFVRIPRIPVLLAITAYQRTLSPDHGPLSRLFPNGYCKYHPSCSQYAYEVVDKLGIIRGVPLAAWRILRCNPWSKGGIDNIPTKK
jgi:putative membrane protein insertion efficiency factor